MYIHGEKIAFCVLAVYETAIGFRTVKNYTAKGRCQRSAKKIYGYRLNGQKISDVLGMFYECKCRYLCEEKTLQIDIYRYLVFFT